jgi:iron complex transport system permease protein
LTRTGRWGFLLCGLALLLVVSAGLALCIGGGRALGSGVVSDWLRDADPLARSIVLDVRLPRVLLAVLVGAALSAAGVAFQATLRNPLADPYILGVSGGAALGAVLFTVVASRNAEPWLLGRPFAAFLGALTTLVVLFGLARARGRTEATSLLLIGVVVNALDSAVILFLVTAGDTARFQSVLFFLVGNIGSPPVPVLVVAGLTIAAGLVVLLLRSNEMNLLAAGDDTAAHLGVDVERSTWLLVGAASLVTATAVAFTGLVGFVGLIVPHALRTALGPDHRLLVPAAALGGGAFLALADAVARAIVAPAEMPVGVVTALVGAPLFLALYLERFRED